MNENQITEAIDDMLYTLALVTKNDDEPTDRELAVLREIIEARAAKREARLVNA